MPDRELRRMRRDLSAFADGIGWPLMKWQARDLSMQARTTYIVGPRQSGKSRSIAVASTFRAFREPGHHVLIVSASELGAKRLLSTIADLITSSPMLAGSLDADPMTSLIRLDNGSTIRSVPASARAIRGWTIDTLIIDEAVEVGDAIIDAALPTTAARPNARVVLLSTGGAPVGRAYETWSAGHSSSGSLVRSHVWRLADCPWISPAAIEHARLTMPKWAFDAEYMGEWLGGSNNPFAAVLRKCVVPFELPGLAQMTNRVRLLAGADWGATFDQTVLMGIARVVTGGQADRPVFVCWPLRVFDRGHSLNGAAREIAEGPAHYSVLSMETNGIGHGPTELAHDVLVKRFAEGAHAWQQDGGNRLDFDGPVKVFNPTNTSWQRKADGIGRLLMLAENDQLLIASHEQFNRQLAVLQIEHRQHSTGIEAPSGEHDDFVDAAYLATGSYTPQGTSVVRNVLADLAQRDDPEAAMPSSASDAPSLVTPAGMTLPVAPWLQSVGASTAVQAPGQHDAIHVPSLIAQRAYDGMSRAFAAHRAAQ